jgi:para-aminobenzoate synthetase/4-amino-4-deoxychorismate lyase
MDAVFALLDDQTSSPATPCSRLYSGYLHEHRCTDPATLDATCAAAAADLAAGHHAVLLADYEWGAKLLRAGHRHLPDTDPTGALRLLIFRHCERLVGAAVNAWLAAHDAAAPEAGPAGFSDLRTEIDERDFAAAIAQIHEWIRAGETYQVNYTYRMHGQAWGDPVALYRRLRARQPVAFGALLHLPEDGWVLSCSPELFLQHRQGRLSARPMKGTAARAMQADADRAAAAWLQADIKNRAENLMIVDLLRNDLGRVARTGSVKVPKLFEIEAYPSVWQMTSSITAELPPATGLAALLRSLFPCGSITGAPKHHTMELIAQLEASPRGLYTGAIGWLDAPADPRRAVGDFCFSVAIRTLTLGPLQSARDGGRRAATLGVGAGIVLDSVAADEAQECRLKARFATALDPGFTLFETLRAEGGRLLRRDAHLARLSGSASALGFVFDDHAARAALARALADAAGPCDCLRVRLDLAADGTLQVRTAPLAALASGAAEPVRVLLAEQPVPPHETALLGHKTSRRSHYDAAIRQAETAGAFDMLFFDAAGNLTEGARSNVFVQLDGRWYTPPARGQLLPGVLRAALLRGDQPGPIEHPTERPISRAELLRAGQIVLCNSLRGLLPARLTNTQAAPCSHQESTP